MTIMLNFLQCPDDDEKVQLKSTFTCCTLKSDWDPIEDMNVKIILSIDEEEEDIPEKCKFSFKFNRKYRRFMNTIRSEARSPSDIKKLMSSNSKILGNFTMYIKFTKEYLFKKKFLEEIDWNNEFKNSMENDIDVSYSFNSGRKEHFGMSKNILIKISPVFKAMLKYSEKKETQENHLDFEDKDFNSIQTLCSLLLLTGSFPCIRPSRKYPTPLLDLLIIADKYDIKSLYKICSEHISKNFANENALKVLKVSDMVNDEKLFAKAMKHFLATKEKEVRECFLKHPEIIAEMMDLAYPLKLDN